MTATTNPSPVHRTVSAETTESRSTASPLIQGAGCLGCLRARYLPFTRACGVFKPYAYLV